MQVGRVGQTPTANTDETAFRGWEVCSDRRRWEEQDGTHVRAGGRGTKLLDDGFGCSAHLSRVTEAPRSPRCNAGRFASRGWTGAGRLARWGKANSNNNNNKHQQQPTSTSTSTRRAHREPLTQWRKTERGGVETAPAWIVAGW